MAELAVIATAITAVIVVVTVVIVVVVIVAVILVLITIAVVVVLVAGRSQTPCRWCPIRFLHGFQALANQRSHHATQASKRRPLAVSTTPVASLAGIAGWLAHTTASQPPCDVCGALHGAVRWCQMVQRVSKRGRHLRSTDTAAKGHRDGYATTGSSASPSTSASAGTSASTYTGVSGHVSRRGRQRSLGVQSAGPGEHKVAPYIHACAFGLPDNGTGWHTQQLRSCASWDDCRGAGSSRTMLALAVVGGRQGPVRCDAGVRFKGVGLHAERDAQVQRRCVMGSEHEAPRGPGCGTGIHNVDRHTLACRRRHDQRAVDSRPVCRPCRHGNATHAYRRTRGSTTDKRRR